MKRVIKLRVWDDRHGQWLTRYEDFEPLWGVDLANLKANLRTFNLIRLDGGEGPGSFIVQQYIGMKDKNDKEIYEGDILKYETHKKPVIVRFTDESYDNHPGFIIKDLWGQYGDCEIIGNIFENPELLK